MGYSYMPKYRVETHERKPNGEISITKMAWDGRATVALLEKWVMAYNKSFQPGGANFHISKALGYVPYAHRAEIINQKKREIVAAYSAPAFLVL